ncbi:hypothetical protein BDY24DRAFT_415955 [Mrakia frigida]|uniref:uncharacterized protein n=1 Tax=Mrakia frigida TaxID=29902 RepID=UPI003FCC2630
MGIFYDEIPSKPDLMGWIAKQKIFFVGTAPLSGDGNVNISPKGTVGSFHIADSTHVWYEDLTGSGSETIAHIEENERITIMFAAFEGAPRIVRLFGRGKSYFRGSPEYESYLPESAGRMPGSRAVVVVEVLRCSSTCGFSIPFMEYLKERETLDNWAAKKEVDTHFEVPLILPPTSDENQEDTPASTTTIPASKNDLRVYWARDNSHSIDGLPSLGTFINDRSSPPSKSKRCTSSSSPSHPPSFRLPSIRSVFSHAVVGGVVGGLVYGWEEGWIDVKMAVGLVGATGAWVVETMVGVPVPAPCCAMGM